MLVVVVGGFFGELLVVFFVHVVWYELENVESLIGFCVVWWV